jgi:hypothetical protein
MLRYDARAIELLTLLCQLKPYLHSWRMLDAHSAGRLSKVFPDLRGASFDLLTRVSPP